MALTKIKGAGINISAAEKLYFDGGGTTYIQESADGVLDFYADNVKMLELLEGATDYVWIPVDATKFAIGAGKDLNIYTSSDDAIIENITSDKDIIFKGNDGGSTITALTLDISAAGAATFNDKIIATELDISGNIDIDGTTNLDVVDIDGAFTQDGGAVFNEDSADVDFRVESNGNTHMLFVDAGSDHVNIGTATDFGGVLNVSTADNNIQLVLASTDADSNEGPIMDFHRNSSSPATNDYTGVIRFRGENDNDEAINYAQIQTQMTGVGDSSEEGKFWISTMKGGTERQRMSIAGGETIFNEDSQDIDFRVESDGNANMFVVDAGNNRVGIGTNAPTSIFDVQASSGASLLYEDAGEGLLSLITSGGTAVVRLEARSGELNYINNGGSLLVGTATTVTNSSEGVEIRGDYGYIKTGRNATGSAGHILFYNPNGNVGDIATSGTSTAYNTSSDYRLKENQVLIPDGLTRLNQLKPYRFNFKADKDTIIDGFFAHEVSNIVPEAITGEKDAVDNDGNIEPQKIDQAKLVPLLVKAVQELSAKVEELEGN